MKITRENLEENGWVFNQWEYDKFDGKLESWDKDFETVGSLDVSTYEQIDDLLKLLCDE